MTGWDHTEGLDAGAECLQAALDYLERGWSALCLCPPDHVGVGGHSRSCASPGKAPLHVWRDCQERRLTPADLQSHWRKHANANVGVALGPVSGLVGVDVDGEEGEADLAEWSGGDLPDTLEFTSGRGRRLLYAIPAGIVLRTTHSGTAAKHALSFLAKGSQTVMPPSRHQGGNRYVWVAGRSPREILPAPAPAWLLDALAPDRRGERGCPPPSSSPFSRESGDIEEGEIIPEGRRNTTLASMAGTMRKRGFGVEAIRMALEEENNSRCDPPLPCAQVAKIAASVGRYVPDRLAGVRIVGVGGRPDEPTVVNGSAPGTATVESYTHDDLLDASFPPLQWMVEGLAPAGGLAILGGKKKLGKSWLCMQIAQAVALGAVTLGKTTHRSNVVYICLEDGGRRLQDRLKKQQSPRGLPIRWYTSFPKLDSGGLDTLAEVMSTGPALLIIDTLAAAKTGRIDENASGPMADLGNALRALAQQYSVGILITHHHGKHSYGDPGDDLRGSSAIAAAADLNLGIYRVEDGFRFRGEGRDIEPFDYAVTFDAHATWTWQLIGDARTMASEEADKAVLFSLANIGESDAEAVAASIGKTVNKVRDRLNELVGQGKVLMREDRSEGQRGRPRILYRLPPADAAFNTPF